MRILMVNPYALPLQEPGGTRHISLARQLTRLGHQVTIVASGFDHASRRDRLGPGEDRRLEILDGVRFLQVRTPPYHDNGPGRLWNMLAFSRIVKGGLLSCLDAPPDVVVGSSPHLFGARAALHLAEGLRTPFVLEVRDVWPRSLVEVMGVPRWHPIIWVMERIERELYRRSDRIVTLLPNLGPRVAAQGGDPSLVTWVSNGIDLDLVPPVVEPRDRDVFTLLYAGSHGRTNALDVLLDAARLLGNRQDSLPRRLELVFLGDGPEKARLEARARNLGLSNAVFLPAVPKREVYGFLASADAFWISTQDSPLWDFGVAFNKIFDGMAMARPTVLGLGNPDNPISRSGGGIRVAPGDARAMAAGVEGLLDMGHGARVAMGRRARAYVEEHFDMGVLALRFEQALRLAAEGRTVHAG